MEIDLLTSVKYQNDSESYSKFWITYFHKNAFKSLRIHTQNLFDKESSRQVNRSPYAST